MKKPGKSFAVTIMLLAVCGLLVSLLLMHEHYLGKSYRDQSKSTLISEVSGFACGDQSSYFNCEDVDSSPYSTLFGFPLSAWGIMYFLILGAIAAFWSFAPASMGAMFAALMFWVSLVGVLFDFSMLMISVFLINSVCPLCTVSYAPTLLSLVLIMVYMKRESGFSMICKPLFQGDENTNRGLLKIAVILLLAILMSAGIAAAADFLMKNAKPDKTPAVDQKTVEESVNAFFRESISDVGDSGACMMGTPGAPVIITVFSDFFCSHCAKTAALLEEVLRENKDNAGLVFMNYPLDTNCNSNIKNNVHDGACIPARGSLCAARQGKFKELHDALFSCDINWLTATKGKITYDLASAAGLDMLKFSLCIAEPGTSAEVQDQIMLGANNGVTSTPTIFINGRQYRFKPDKDIIGRIIERIMDTK